MKKLVGLKYAVKVVSLNDVFNMIANGAELKKTNSVFRLYVQGETFHLEGEYLTKLPYTYIFLK